MKNTIFTGDNLAVMRSLPADSVDLIYLDPPFFTQTDFGCSLAKGQDHISFSDTWTSRRQYLDFISDRLVETKRILKDTGSIYLHCDTKMSHYLKVQMDEVFGYNSFTNEIVWKTFFTQNTLKSRYAKRHELILFYQNPNATFNMHYTPLTEEHIEAFYRKRDEKGRYWLQYKGRSGRGETYKCYLHESKGISTCDLWDDIKCLSGGDKERVGYPTQKPIALLDRIIRHSSNPADIILDPFCGSGTTLIASDRLQRKWIGIDDNVDAIPLLLGRIDAEQGMFKNYEHIMFGHDVIIDEMGVDCKVPKTYQPKPKSDETQA